MKIVEFQSITKASEALFLTQPAVSIQLKRLQDQFEIPLTEVIGRQLYITDFGNQIAEVSRNIIREAETIKTTIDQYHGLLTGKIEVSTVSTGKYIIPYFLSGFMKKYPGVEMIVDVSNREKVLASLSDNESDFSLVSVLPDSTPVKKIDLMENKLYMVASSRLHTGKLSTNSLENETIILRENGSATRKAMEGYLEKYEVPYRKSMVMVSNEAVKQAVLAGIGYSIMPLIGLRNELANGSLRICEMEGLPIITNWNLIYEERKKLTPASLELISYINEHKQSVVSQYFNFEVMS